tara:strand:+ start:10672 stop:12447 length:1776 start_codon:yes stop_codon:yes gene_type:complete
MSDLFVKTASQTFCDVNKQGTEDSMHVVATGDNTCWLVTAANMLGAAGYYSKRSAGTNIQNRAQCIYEDMIDWQGTVKNGGWVDTAIQWWLSSSHNAAAESQYSIITIYGSKTKIPWQDIHGSTKIGMHLRSGDKVGVSISWPVYKGSVGTGGHSITCFGDDLPMGYESMLNKQSGNNNSIQMPLDQVSQIWVADSDRYIDPARMLQTYDYDDYNEPNPGKSNLGKGWYINYSNNHPFIKHICVLRTVSRKENDGILNNPVQLSCIRYTFPMTCNGHNVSYTVRTEGRIMSYVTFIEYKGTRIDIPVEYIKEVANDESGLQKGIIVSDYTLPSSIEESSIVLTTVFWAFGSRRMFYDDIYVNLKSENMLYLPNLSFEANTPVLDKVSSELNSLTKRYRSINTSLFERKLEMILKSITHNKLPLFNTGGFLYFRIRGIVVEEDKSPVSFLCECVHEFSWYQDIEQHFISLQLNSKAVLKIKTVEFTLKYGMLTQNERSQINWHLVPFADKTIAYTDLAAGKPVDIDLKLNINYPEEDIIYNGSEIVFPFLGETQLKDKLSTNTKIGIAVAAFATASILAIIANRMSRKKKKY